MDIPGKLVVFTLDHNSYAIPLAAVERTVRIVDVTPLPHAPEIVTGVINLQGIIIPVLNIRRRFRLPERRATLSDQFLIARTARRTVALAVDAVNGVIEPLPHEITRDTEIVPGLDYLEGVVKLDDGMLLVHDLDRFLSLDEERDLAAALTRDAS